MATQIDELVKLNLSGHNAMSVLGRIAKQTDNEVQLVMDSSVPDFAVELHFTVWAAGCESIHTLTLKADGTWALLARVEV